MWVMSSEKTGKEIKVNEAIGRETEFTEGRRKAKQE